MIVFIEFQQTILQVLISLSLGIVSHTSRVIVIPLTFIQWNPCELSHRTELFASRLKRMQELP